MVRTTWLAADAVEGFNHNCKSGRTLQHMVIVSYLPLLHSDERKGERETEFDESEHANCISGTHFKMENGMICRDYHMNYDYL